MLSALPPTVLVNLNIRARMNRPTSALVWGIHSQFVLCHVQTWQSTLAGSCSIEKRNSLLWKQKGMNLFLAGLSINDSIPSLMQFTDNSQQQVQSTLPSNLTARFLIRSLNTCFHKYMGEISCHNQLFPLIFRLPAPHKLYYTA